MGTHAQYMLVPEYICLPIPDEIPFVIGAMIDDCIGTPHRAIRRTGVQAGDTVLVTGVGPIGASAVVIAKFLNAVVIASDTNEYRLNHASLLGANYILNPNKEDLLAKVRDITKNTGVDVAIDCSGADVAQVQCLNAVRQGGKVAFIGIKSESTSINITRQFILKELTAIGSWASTAQEHLEIIRLIERGMPVEKIITHRYDIGEAATAFRQFFSGEAVKVTLDPWKTGPNQ
jgi:threonine dehydrogenase-like Zn-dependent dehydrogenase